jgi:6-phosphogluconolactonase (cycloisomerase 2 family)
MRFSPTKLLHGLLYAAPVILLTLVACGGGGSTPSAPLAVYYTVGGTVTGLVSGDTLVLRNNGGDDKTITADGSYTFSTAIVAGGSYNATVLTHPRTPLVKECTFPGSSSGSNLSGNVTNVNVSCIGAYTIGGTISGLTSNGLVLQNNGGDNLLVPAGAATFTFSTPLANPAPYDVTVLTQPNSPAQTCIVTAPSGNVASANVTSVSIACIANLSPPVDKYAYAANFGSNTVKPYVIASGTGVLTGGTAVATGNGPYAVAVDSAGQFVYVTNQSANTISAYSIGGGGALTPLTDVDAGTPGNQTSIATGSTPLAIAIHPSGKFAYVVNNLNNSVSAYSIDAAGALARIDSDGLTPGNQTSIPARSGAIAIALDPVGAYAYVANAVDNSVSVYSIDATSGALTAIDADGGTGGPTYIATGGTTPYSVSVDPTGQFAYVANGGDGTVSVYSITSGALGRVLCGPPCSVAGNIMAGSTPRSVTVHPSGLLAYVVNSSSSDISAYTINPGSGALTQVDCGGGSTCDVVNSLPKNFKAGTNPFSISIDSSGNYAYVANSGSANVSAYSINTSNGVLTPLASSPFAAGTSPYGVTTAP